MKYIPTLPVLTLWIGTFAGAFTIGYTIRPDEPGTSEAFTANRSDPSLTDRLSGARISKTATEAAETDALALDAEGVLSDLEADFFEAMKMPETDPKRMERLRDTLEKIAAVNPLLAIELAAKINSLRERERAESAILEIWARSDPAAALAWAQNNLGNETFYVRSTKLEAIYRGYAAFNPNAAFLQASQLSTASATEARLRSRILNEIIETQIENGGILEAKATIEALEEGREKEDLMREMIDSWASYDPASAVAYINQLGESASARLKSTLAAEWAESDPAAAAAWLSSLSQDDPAVGMAADNIIREWARYDMNASAEWLNSLPATPELDRAVAGYTFQAAEEDPEVAMSWAESISNDRMRTHLMERVAAEWKSSNPEALKTYVEASDLSAEQKQVLLEAEQRGGPPRMWRR